MQTDSVVASKDYALPAGAAWAFGCLQAQEQLPPQCSRHAQLTNCLLVAPGLDVVSVVPVVCTAPTRNQGCQNDDDGPPPRSTQVVTSACRAAQDM